MAKPVALPASGFAPPADLLAEIVANPGAVVYFLCNIGDGDAQVVLLPADEHGHRQIVVVDVGRSGKVPALLKTLHDGGVVDLMEGDAEPIALVVATHPHDDHIRGMPELFDEFGPLIAEFWDPGFFHTVPAYHKMMASVEGLEHLLYAQPTSGFRRWIGDIALTVLAPSVHLRNRFDSYGTEINDASISLRLEFPARRFLERKKQGAPVDKVKTRALVLGADAQTLSWSYVLTDFPFLRKSDTPAAKVIAAAQGDVDLLGADVLKVSHHASKHGVNLELVERIAPAVTLVSSVGGGGQYNFPHTVAQELIREALDPSTTDEHPHRPDHEMGVYYTCDTDDDDGALGTIAMMMTLREATIWRLGDEPEQKIDLSSARKLNKRAW